MKHTSLQSILLLIFLVTNIHFFFGQLAITPDHPEGVYEIGETVTWSLNFNAEPPTDSIQFTLKRGGLTVLKKGILFSRNSKTVISHYFNEPGAVLLEVAFTDAKGDQHSQVAGAIAAPERINLSTEKPTDFDAFWNKQIAGLASISTKPKLRKEKSDTEGINYWKLEMNHIFDSKIRGQIARPKKGQKLPALLIVQWAGVYPLQKQWVLEKAKKGWLVLNINAHDLPIDKEDSFYKVQTEGPLKKYPGIGNEDKNTSYFLRMYLSCYQAAQYLTERSDWNRETLVVMGTSQGGMQSLVTAGLHPKISASLALVPAGFDMYGPKIGRRGGWPQWYNATENKDAEKVRETSRYFDVANFIPRIKCPVLVGIGLLDQTCPPEGIYAGLNQLDTQKEIILLPNSEHQAKNHSQKRYYDRAEEHWLPVLLKGTNPVIK